MDEPDSICFCSHGSTALVDESAVMAVPEGVSAADAAFLPSMETALSLAHAARVSIGEKVAVIGQGLIGQLTAAVLAGTCSSLGGVQMSL